MTAKNHFLKILSVGIFALTLCLGFLMPVPTSQAGLSWTSQTYSGGGSGQTQDFPFYFNTSVRSPSMVVSSNPQGADVWVAQWLTWGPLYYGAVVRMQKVGGYDYHCPDAWPDGWGGYSCSGDRNCGAAGCSCAANGGCSVCGCSAVYVTQRCYYDWGNYICEPIYGSYSVSLYFTGVRNYIDEPYLYGSVPSGAPYGSNIGVTTGAVSLADPANPVFNWSSWGSGQSAYRLQILQGGSVVWDSGDVSNGAQSRQAGPLNLATTYTWRIAVAGPAWGSYPAWTGWADGGAFTTSLPPPTADIKANGSDGPIDIPYNTAATITWSSTSAASCSISPSGWSGTSGSQSSGALTVSQTYTATCTGAGGGPASDSVIVSVLPPPSTPSVSDLSSIQPDYCVSGPAAVLSWNFSDQETGDTQSAYQVQADNASDFSSPEINTGKITSASHSYSTGPGILQYNATYYWRVKVWDSHDNESAWSASSNLATPRHQYPAINFSWAPVNPSIEESTQMADQSTVYGGATKSVWLWNIPDVIYVGGTNSSSQNPQVRFTLEGSKSVNLQVTDSDGYTCSAPKAINIRLPLPGWKEVAPE